MSRKLESNNVETRSDTWLRWGVCLSSVWWWGSDDVQVCLIKAQVKSGAGVRSEWWRTDRSVTLPPPPGRRVPRRSINTGKGGWAPWRLMQARDTGKASMADLRLRWPWRDRRLGRPRRIRGLGRPWRIRSLGWPWRIRGLGRPWRIRSLGWPWRIWKLGRPWRIRSLGWPWWYYLLGRSYIQEP